MDAETLEKAYQPASIESNLYERWEKAGYFAPHGNGQPYCIMIPPPNVTGSLHMGHAFQQTLMDILIRYHRMKGDKTLWQVGTDHASIATQMVVERMLLAEGTSRHDIGRDPFIDRVWQWKEESGGNITRQLRRIGASVDWPRERFTMDEGLSAAVQAVFIQLYQEGLIYRGKRLVNWDPVLLTAVSDLEVESIEEQGSLWYIRYPLELSENLNNGKNNLNNHRSATYLVVATTRPETMLGDVAVAVNPKDERYATLIGKKVKLPLTDRVIPIIADDTVDPSFGTGCVKITPAHDFNDYAMGERHKLPLINIFNSDATLNDEVPIDYRGLERFKARKKIVQDLKNLEFIEKIEPHTLNVPRGDRSGAVLEPLLTDQWFVKIEPLASPAIEAVESGKIRFIPENWSKTYFEWMRNIQDWCISRQLWWGHRIPAWYDNDGNIYVAENVQAVREKYGLDARHPLKQDEDVLDTWFSAALWPFSTLGWPEETHEFKTFYPTQVLITGFDIIFFWVARMIMFGLKFAGDIPFHEVYIHGLIQDQNGQKMSKTKGNVLDPIDLIDGIDLETLVQKRTQGLMQPKLAEQIAENTRKQFPEGIPAFGTDALRFTFAALATNGRHIRFDLKKIESYRHFCNKLWNATRYVLMHTEGKLDLDLSKADGALEQTTADKWIYALWQKTLKEVELQLNAYRFDLASYALYDFVWNEFCDWYLEFSKPILADSNTENARFIQGTRYTLITLLEEILRALHPFMPYITETLWQRVAMVAGKVVDPDNTSIMVQPYPQGDKYQFIRGADAIAEIFWVKDLVLSIRNIRGEMNISPAKPIPVYFCCNAEVKEQELHRHRLEKHYYLLQALAKIEYMEWLEATDAKPAAATGLSGNLEILVPLANLIDKEAEISRLKKEVDKLKKELDKSQKQLSNDHFVKNAPAAVVEKEKNNFSTITLAIEKLESKLQEMLSMT